jgi:hypothetical protein
MLRAKQGRLQSWLPNQVYYGMDCSDTDPQKWKPFGQFADEQEAAAQKAKPTTVPPPKA